VQPRKIASSLPGFGTAFVVSLVIPASFDRRSASAFLAGGRKVHVHDDAAKNRAPTELAPGQVAAVIVLCFQPRIVSRYKPKLLQLPWSAP
jgi:hypothetical protein